MFGYLDCFSDYAGMVAANVGYDFCFVKVSTVSGTLECSDSADRWFSSLVSLMCSAILVEM
jgi:hypothetical protein